MVGNAGKGLNIKAEHDKKYIRKEIITMHREREIETKESLLLTWEAEGKGLFGRD